MKQVQIVFALILMTLISTVGFAKGKEKLVRKPNALPNAYGVFCKGSVKGFEYITLLKPNSGIEIYEGNQVLATVTTSDFSMGPNGMGVVISGKSNGTKIEIKIPSNEGGETTMESQVKLMVNGQLRLDTTMNCSELK